MSLWWTVCRISLFVSVCVRELVDSDCWHRSVVGIAEWLATCVSDYRLGSLDVLRVHTRMSLSDNERAVVLNRAVATYCYRRTYRCCRCNALT